MNSFELVVWDDEGEKCTFYTVVQEGLTESEMDRFLHRFEEDAVHQQALDELVDFILTTLKERYGPLNIFFNRNENEVEGLPPKGKIRFSSVEIEYPHFPLRLYALKLSENLVVLFNGGIKDGPTNQTSSLLPEWQAACGFAVRIIEAIRTGEIEIDEKNRQIVNHLGKPENLFL